MISCSNERNQSRKYAERARRSHTPMNRRVNEKGSGTEAFQVARGPPTLQNATMPTPRRLYLVGISTEKEIVQFLADPGPPDDIDPKEPPMDRARRIADQNMRVLAGRSARFIQPVVPERFCEPPSGVAATEIGKARFWRLP
jgi:hypothetical protein